MYFDLKICSAGIYIDTVELEIDIEEIFGYDEDLENIKGKLKNLHKKNDVYVADFLIDETHTHVYTNKIAVAFDYNFNFPFALEIFNNSDASVDIIISLSSARDWDFRYTKNGLDVLFLISEMRLP